MSSVRYSMVIAISIVVLVLSGCQLLVPKPELTAELSNLTLCQGWDDDGDPTALPDNVPSDETRICICGDLEANRDVGLQVFWGKEGNSLLRDRRMFSNGPFLSCIEEAEGFEPGDYKVAVVMGKRTLGLLEFSVSN